MCSLEPIISDILPNIMDNLDTENILNCSLVSLKWYQRCNTIARITTSRDADNSAISARFPYIVQLTARNSSCADVAWSNLRVLTINIPDGRRISFRELPLTEFTIYSNAREQNFKEHATLILPVTLEKFTADLYDLPLIENTAELVNITSFNDNSDNWRHNDDYVSLFGPQLHELRMYNMGIEGRHKQASRNFIRLKKINMSAYHDTDSALFPKYGHNMKYIPALTHASLTGCDKSSIHSNENITHLCLIDCRSVMLDCDILSRLTHLCISGNTVITNTLPAHIIVTTTCNMLNHKKYYNTH